MKEDVMIGQVLGEIEKFAGAFRILSKSFRRGEKIPLQSKFSLVDQVEVVLRVHPDLPLIYEN